MNAYMRVKPNKKMLCILLFLLMLLLGAQTSLATTEPAFTLKATKVWTGDTAEQRAATTPAYLVVATRGTPDANGARKLTVLTNPADNSAMYSAEVDRSGPDTQSFTFDNLPVPPSGSDYTVLEVQSPQGPSFNATAPAGYLRSTTIADTGTNKREVTITNTRQPDLPALVDGDISTMPCQLNWYSEVAMDATLMGYEGYSYDRSKVSDEHFHTGSPGFMVTQPWIQGDAIWWRVIVGTERELHNARLSIDFAGLVAQGMMVNPGSLEFMSGDYAAGWMYTGSNLVQRYSTYKLIKPSDTDYSISENQFAMQLDHMNPYEVVALTFGSSTQPGSITPALSKEYLATGRRLDGTTGPLYAMPILDGTRYWLKPTFTADMNCVIVEKTWRGEGQKQPATFELLRQLPGETGYTPMIDGMRTALQAQLGQDVSLVAEVVNFGSATTPYERPVPRESAALQALGGPYPDLRAALRSDLLAQDTEVWGPVNGVNRLLGHRKTLDQAWIDALLAEFAGLYTKTLQPPAAGNTASLVFENLRFQNDQGAILYSVRETDAGDGWIQAGPVQIITQPGDAPNKQRLAITNEPAIPVTATKTWSNLTQQQAQQVNDNYLGAPPPFLDVWFRLYRTYMDAQGQPVTEPVPDVPVLQVPFPSDTAGQVPPPPYTASVTWHKVARYLTPDQPYTYSVREVDANGHSMSLGQFTIVENGLNVTNTYFPVQDGVLVDDPCRFTWYAEAFARADGKDFANRNYLYKVSKGLFAHHKGSMEVQHFFMGDGPYFRVQATTDYAMDNVVLELDFSTITNWEPDLSGTSISFITQGSFDMFDHSPSKGAAYRIITPMTAQQVLDAYDPATRKMTLPIGYLPANGGFQLALQGKALGGIDRTAEYHLGATLTGEYNCLRAIKTWLGPDATRPDITLRLTQNGQLVTRDSIRAALGNGPQNTTLLRENAMIIRPYHRFYMIQPGDLIDWIQKLAEQYPSLAPLMTDKLKAIHNDDSQWTDLPDRVFYNGRDHDAQRATIVLDSAFLDGLADAIYQDYSVTLKAGTTEYVWPHLSFRTAAGEPIVYGLVEDPLPGYAQVGDPVVTSDPSSAHHKRTITITNQPTTSFAGTKTWADPLGIEVPAQRPWVQLQLQRDGVDYLDPVALDPAASLATNQSTYTWQNLPTYNMQTGVAYAYSIREIPPPHYQYVQTAANAITNRYTPGTFTGTKLWTGSLPPAGTTVTLTLVQTVLGDTSSTPYRKEMGSGLLDGQADAGIQSDPLRDGERNPWHYTWHNLPATGLVEGVERSFEYEVIEKAPPTGYAQDMDTLTSASLSVVNDSQLVTLEGVKTWVGGPVTDRDTVPLVVLQNGVPMAPQPVPAVRVQGDTQFLTYSVPRYRVWDAQSAANRVLHTYALAERDAAEGRVVINGNVYAVAVDGNTYTNTYLPPTPAQVQLTARKQLVNGTLVNGAYRFVLSNAQGQALQTVQNAADGTIAFEPLRFTAPGDYRFLLHEEQGTATSITYDSAVYTLDYAWQVDSSTNTLVGGLVSLQKDGKALPLTEPLVFRNVFTPPPPPPTYEPVDVVLGARKALTGRLLKENEFRFVLRGGDGKVIEEVGNTADGRIDFGPRRFIGPTQPDRPYIYTIEELKGTGANINYDATRYSAEVTVTADGEVLRYSVQYLKDGTPWGGEVAFHNRYDPPRTGDSFLGTAGLLALLALIPLGGWLVLKQRKETK